MTLFDNIRNDVNTTIRQEWNLRGGKKVPSNDDITLTSGGAVELEATFLYADLADSSKIVKELNRNVAAKIIKSFLATTARLVRYNGGTIVSFDGDRILGVFYGNSKNTSAAKCALQINHTVQYIIRPAFEAKYKTVREASFRINHGTGIDAGTVLAVRAGARGDNDLVWIGRAPNLAAKLSDLREIDNQTVITASVFNKLHESLKYSGSNHVWENRTWSFLNENINVYRSGYHWTLT